MICVENKTGKEFAYRFIEGEKVELQDYEEETIILDYDDWKVDYLTVDKWRQKPTKYDPTYIEPWRKHGIEL